MAEQMSSERAPTASDPEVVPLPAPLLQLLYAYYFLTRPTNSRLLSRPGWLQRLSEREPELVAQLAAAPSGEGRHYLFTVAGKLGYWNDPDADRFLTDLPQLPAMLLGKLDSGEVTTSQTGLRDWLQQRTADVGQWLGQLRGLHVALAREWSETGLKTVESHRELFLSRYREHKDVIKALPPYHFIRFEKTATPIRNAEGQQQIIVVPLYFAAAGGFSLASGGRQFVGYGLSSEYLFEDTRARVMKDARSIKALADPTRLLLLTLIARYSGFSLTVGDLAQYLGVSQPTVSGHLKILRDSGLVEVERQGNRSFYRPDTAAIRDLITDMNESLLPH